MLNLFKRDVKEIFKRGTAQVRLGSGLLDPFLRYCICLFPFTLSLSVAKAQGRDPRARGSTRGHPIGAVGHSADPSHCHARPGMKPSFPTGLLAFALIFPGFYLFLNQNVATGFSGQPASAQVEPGRRDGRAARGRDARAAAGAVGTSVQDAGH